ncbi:hypothetical protein GCM10017620_31310 [Brevundimonas intermedia]|uniref:Flagellar hook-length control protein FliK n=2 Tax=Brevundimonas intermedia TaxID=74315 RepID=A0ABQ5TDI6_9CAUL|nr:hypothetical protein GCM10017620_31310 [Brevundimonas intermedia]
MGFDALGVFGRDPAKVEPGPERRAKSAVLIGASPPLQPAPPPGDSGELRPGASIRRVGEVAGRASPSLSLGWRPAADASAPANVEAVSGAGLSEPRRSVAGGIDAPAPPEGGDQGADASGRADVEQPLARLPNDRRRHAASRLSLDVRGSGAVVSVTVNASGLSDAEHRDLRRRAEALAAAHGLALETLRINGRDPDPSTLLERTSPWR